MRRRNSQPISPWQLQLVTLSKVEEHERAIGQLWEWSKHILTRMPDQVPDEMVWLGMSRALQPDIESLEAYSPLAMQAAEVVQLARQGCDADTVEARLDVAVHLKNTLQRAIEIARALGRRMYKHALVVLYEAIRNTYAEELSDESWEALSDAAASLQDLDISRDEVRELAAGLRGAGFQSFPTLASDKGEELLESLGLTE